MSEELDVTDKKIINSIQSSFPVDSHPYRVLAGRIGITEEEALERIRRLRHNGIIRRIGAVFDSSRLGFSSTLIGVKTLPEHMEEIARGINMLSGVTHHYQREGEYNLWFTLTAKDRQVIDGVLREMQGWAGVEDIIDLPASRTFKIKVDFRL